MLQNLTSTLKAVDKLFEIHETSDGTRLLILPYGGRILGVYSPGSDENFLWTNSVLEKAESAHAYYESDDWQNSGGDRTWLAPELDFFFSDVSYSRSNVRGSGQQCGGGPAAAGGA